MWTPRRVLMMAVGLGLFVAVFTIYNQFLGWIDGFPTLPDRYLLVAQADTPPLEQHSEDHIRRMLRQAFGDNCPEMRYRYQLRLQTQGIVLAMEDHEIKDGKVVLTPFSLAVFGKTNNRSGFPEINTVHCDKAVVTFDRRIETTSDIGRSKILSAEFSCDPAIAANDPRPKGFIFVVHNHGTPQAADDLIAKARGPIYFEDTAAKQSDKPQLWTNNSVEITDYQSQPPHVVAAQTFSLFLHPDALRPGEKTAKSRERANAVRMVELGNVHMILRVDRGSDFLASPDPLKSPPAHEVRPVLTIRTPGKFRFDVDRGYAEFGIDASNRNENQIVEVVRGLAVGNDELTCDVLGLQFLRQSKGPSKTGDTNGPLEIDEVRATGRKVVITSVVERIRAVGRELVFKKERREVELRGSPMSAVKDGNQIVAPELFLHRPDPSKASTKPGEAVALARVSGRGVIYLHDEQGRQHAEVHWGREMKLEREAERDRLTLDGDAAFEDRDNGQTLAGEQIKIWLKRKLASDRTSEPEGVHARPERMHVIGRVELRTPQIRIDKTPTLVVWFYDDVASASEKPSIRTNDRTTPSSIQLVKSTNQVPLAPATGALQPLPRQPIVISAGHIDTVIRRSDVKADLRRVVCKSGVHVRQQADNPADRGLDVTAQELDLQHDPEGDVLRLAGTESKRAHVMIHELTLDGSHILFDQRDNRVEVEGDGHVSLLTATNLNGERLAHPTEIGIDWKKHMTFAGNRISFVGAVQAQQEDLRSSEFQTEKEISRLWCPKMDVYLDRSVSFSQAHREQANRRNAKPHDKPKIQRVVCHQGGIAGAGAVTFANNAWRNGRHIRFQQLDAPELTLDNERGEASVVGKGVMRLFQLGERYDAKEADGNAQTEPIFQLTRVEFAGGMTANNRTRSAAFTGPVRVTHAPTNDPDLIVSSDRLPSGAFRLTCQTLEIITHIHEGRRHAEMNAEGKADIYANEFQGRADSIKYDESKLQQIIFDARDGANPAVLYHLKNKGEAPLEMMGRSIIYWRKTNGFRVIEALGAQASK